MGWFMGIRGLTFSWKRALGITNIKRWIAKLTGIPTTATGRLAKLGRLFAGFIGLFRIGAWGVFLAAIAPDIIKKIKRRYEK